MKYNPLFLQLFEVVEGELQGFFSVNSIIMGVAVCQQDL